MSKATQAKWNALEKAIQEEVRKNVFCVNCGVTTIVDHKIILGEYDTVLEGKCKKCGGGVTRLMESDWL